MKLKHPVKCRTVTRYLTYLSGCHNINAVLIAKFFTCILIKEVEYMYIHFSPIFL